MANTVLVIDPSPKTRDDLSGVAYSTELFDMVLHSRDGMETLSRLQEHPVDMLLWDWRPETLDSGRDLFHALKKREEWADIPVVVFTADASEEVQVDALESGADDCHHYFDSIRQIAARMRMLLRKKARAAQLKAEKQSLARMAVTDMLTGVYNRGYFDATLETEIARARRTNIPSSLLMVDLDNFKSINDNFGHPVGDEVLKAVGDWLRRATRQSDVVCRYGGEEFAVILPGTPSPMAYKVAEKIRKGIAALTPAFGLGGLSVSATIGVSGTDTSQTVSARQLIEEADWALYQGKRKGRNRTEFFKSNKQRSQREGLPIYIGTAVGYA